MTDGAFGRTLIMGNGGCGKTWLARRLGDAFSVPVIHLDEIHWEPGHRGIARDKALVDSDVAALAQSETWVMEGVYGWLVNIALDRVTSLVWIDLPEPECIANITQRGMQGGESEAQFQDLLRWVAAYRVRTKNWNSFEAHARLFAGHDGAKSRLTSRAQVLAYLKRSIAGGGNRAIAD